MNFHRIIILSLASFVVCNAESQVKSHEKQVKKDSIAVNSKEEKNRNVMLNASSTSGPRDVNIGLPASVGGITVLENSLPTVYYMWPELPTRTWRPSVSLDGMGLLKMSELAIKMGDLGYAVSAKTRTGTDKTQVIGSTAINQYGYYNTDLNLSGKIGGRWYYALGTYNAADPTEAKIKATKYLDQTQIYRAVLTYKFKEDKGSISFGYKYARSSMTSNYAVFTYHTDGTVSKYNDFKIGHDSYLLNSGFVRLKNTLTGDPYTLSMNSDNWSSSNTFDVFGNYKLNNNWTLSFSNRLHFSKATILYLVPAGVSTVGSSDTFTYEDGTAYTGNRVQQSMVMSSPNIPTTTFMTRWELNKKTENHNWSIGLLESYYKVDHFRSDRSFYYQTIENNPQLLIKTAGSSSWGISKDGFYGYNIGSEYHNGWEDKLNLYFSDDWNISNKLSISYGLDVQYQKLKGDYSLESRGDVALNDYGFTTFDHNWYHIHGSLKGVYKLTDKFGFTGEFLYQEKHGQLENYSGAYTPSFAKTKTPMLAVGVYFNNKWLSLVSQYTYLTRNNYQTRLNITDYDTGVSSVASVHYDIKTTGWTTDMLLKPFNNFQLHYLLTVQNPTYKNFTYINPLDGKTTVSYNGNTVTSISKILMEIDPTYVYKKLTLALNLRYFSKQYASYTNQFYFAPHWESFITAGYKLNDNINLGLLVVNPLNQTGASGTIYASELPYSDRSKADGSIVTGSYIRPLTFQLTANFHF